ncbi:polysaccharide deacetylase family protein [Paenibacillus sp. N4]|uniref:polysaccharide deacetylase family protein n=1 Tax=Paenibacillus vietnamensis TaxID=2590547 RepID=UPI001CD119B7|nr:polysaccharide deacetylase family protein [Paenibacillus vietnamensis]MCA0757639.1 polysaccharide deacetylase family protein [Paenibacillus vietnamensis]
MLKMLFTVDVEDWFCSPDLPLSEWETCPIRLERPTHRLLDLLDEHGAEGTFFVLGWIAEKRPELVKEIHRRGHEIASHGYAHRLVHRQTPQEFKQDIKHSKEMLEQLTGTEVRGYRAPCFSMTDWGLELLGEEGFAYDSSIMPNSFNPDGSRVELTKDAPPSFPIDKSLWEIPLPSYRAGGMKIPWGGGGYFRLYPYRLFRTGAEKLMRQNGSFVFYIHPYDLDRDQPRKLGTTWANVIRRYYGLGDTNRKLGRLLSDYSCTSIRRQYPHIGELAACE